MGKKNPAREFLKRVKALQDRAEWMGGHQNGKLVDAVDDDGRKVWPFTHDHECHRNQCKKRPDGLWERTQCQYHGAKDYKNVFLWRLFPNYCCWGRPVCTSDKQQEFLDKSETEKILLDEDGIQWVWKWSTVRLPTRVLWGMGMGPTYFEVRKGDEILLQSATKVGVTRWYKEAVSNGLL